MDLISREAVLDETIRRNSIWKGITNSRGENLEQIINRLPTIQPPKPITHESAIDFLNSEGWLYEHDKALTESNQPKKGEWIPVTEPPKDGTTNLVWYEYFRYGNYNCMFETYGIAKYYEGKWFVDNGGAKATVIAWQPLPQPYKADKE